MLRTGTRVRLADTSRGVFHGTVLMGSYPDGSCYVRWDSGVSERLPKSELVEIDGQVGEGAPLNDEGYEPDDPKHPTFRERLSAVWDMRPGK